MADTANLYDLMTLQGVSRRVKVAPAFWLTEFYKQQINFDQEYISFDRVFEDKRYLAPFVVPNVSGRPNRLQGYTSERFKPAYTKQKDIVDPTMHMERMAGEAYGGTLSLQQRRDAVIAYLIQTQKEKTQNTWNYLAARATIDGQVIIKGEDYPETLVDFRRDASLTFNLTGGATWDQGTANPLEDIKDARKQANELSGARISRLVFGGNAWELFTQRVDLKDLMDKTVGGVQATVTRINSLTDGYEDSIEYMGTIAGVSGQGRIECWVDTTRYIDPDTLAETYYLDTDTVVGVSDMMSGVRCFGAIRDKRAGFRSLDMFFKNWDEEDPSQEYLLTQSAPLMVPREPNATFKIKVK
jgi:hypothetical protein